MRFSARENVYTALYWLVDLIGAPILFVASLLSITLVGSAILIILLARE